jgi:hypothetical protein
MDDETRRIIEAACRESDRLQAEFEREQWVRAQQEPPPMIYKRYGMSEPQPQRSATTMDAATQAQWDAWADTRIKKFFAKQPFTKAQGKVIVHVIAALRKEFREQISALLRAEMAVEAGVAKSKGEIKLLRRSKPDAA